MLLLWVETGGTRRVGFAVSRQLNRAVDRNRIRRRLREAYRRSREVGPGGATMVVVGKKRVLKMRFDALVNELAGALGAVSESVPSAGGPR